MGTSNIPLWTPDPKPPNHQVRQKYHNLCIVSVMLAFGIGLLVGVLIPILITATTIQNQQNSTTTTTQIQFKPNNSPRRTMPNYTVTPVQFVQDVGIIENGVFWGHKVEEILPRGFGTDDNKLWTKYVEKSTAVRLENGCGRMQNRLVVFQDGTRGCVRYRQNLDQIQGELFSFYLAQLLNLPNLAPSTISLVDLNAQTWKNIPAEIASAQWSSNRPVVITKFISDLESANIPNGYRPPERQLNHRYVQERNTSVAERMTELVELAQWSDLVIFDYLTANLDRVVNNLYNKQWNANIMEAPAHNLARRSDNLLVFLDNESGLLHGYRLLHKYEPYHSLLLDNLCVFRKPTISALEQLRKSRNIGKLLVQMFERQTGTQIRDVLPSLPEKSIKILNERLDRVHSQVFKCKRNLQRNL